MTLLKVFDYMLARVVSPDGPEPAMSEKLTVNPKPDGKDPEKKHYYHDC